MRVVWRAAMSIAPSAIPFQTDEEPIEGLSFLAYRRVATVIFLPLRHGGAGSFQAIPVTPEALDAAQAQEAPEDRS